jgi:hypothetical protein
VEGQGEKMADRTPLLDKTCAAKIIMTFLGYMNSTGFSVKKSDID